MLGLENGVREKKDPDWCGFVRFHLRMLLWSHRQGTLEGTGPMGETIDVAR